MSKRKIIKMRESVPLDAVFCRDDNGILAVWFGDRRDLKKNDGYWSDTIGKPDNWLELSYSPEFSTPDFCEYFNIERGHLPKPGRTMPVTIELPKWEAELYEQG